MILRGIAGICVIAAIVCITPVAHASFTKVDDFSNYTAGTAINGQGAWHAEAGSAVIPAGVQIDPGDPNNKVLSIGRGNYGSENTNDRATFNNLPSVLLPQGQIGTLFFRFRYTSNTDINFSIGMSDVPDPINQVIFNVFDHFEAQFRMGFAAGFDAISARSGGSALNLTSPVQGDQWYSMWMVINNLADNFQLYLQGGSLAQQTLLSTAANQSTFNFRNGVASNNLLNIFIATGRNLGNNPPQPDEQIGPTLLDDFYFTLGSDLSNPIPEPATGILFILGASAIWRIRGKSLRLENRWGCVEPVIRRQAFRRYFHAE